MKRYMSPMGCVVSGIVAAAGLMCQTAQANSINLNTAYTATLDSAFGTDDITVTYEVFNTFTPGEYLYSYIVNDTTSHPKDTVDEINVAFDTTAPGAYVLGSANLGGSTDAGGISWNISPPVPSGQSTVQYTFLSHDLPTLGLANASDDTDPSPWNSIPGNTSTEVAVPMPPVVTVPDGGLTVAFLGASLIALQVVRRKVVKS